jgi:type VI secretion system protein VasJ
MSTPEVIASRAAPLLEPIAGAEPGGSNATYDPRYDAVRTELAKLDTPTGGEVQWSVVSSGCHELLTAVTKDFLLASQYATAMMQLERWAGLAVGLAVLDGMLDKWWDTGFPPVARLRGRGNALDWLVARLEIAIPTTGVRPEEAAMFETTCVLWSSLSERAKTRLGELTPGMGVVTDALAKVRPAGSSPAPQTNGVAQAPAAAPPEQPAPAADAVPPTPAADAAPPPVEQPTEQPAAPAPVEAKPEPAPPADPLAAYVTKAEQWLAPIPGPNPAGGEARYEIAYEATRVEIAKLDKVTDNIVEWKQVHDNASTILRTKSKDLLMGAYLAFAKLKHSGIDDFCVGLAVLCGMLEKYWDGLQPERLRGRAAALAWMVDQLDKALGEVALTPKDRPLVLALQLMVTRTATLTRERMGHEGPSYGPVAERVQRMLLAVPEAKPAAPPPPPPKPAATPVPAATPTAGAATTPAAAATAAPASLDGVATYLQETGRNLVSTGNRIREASRASAAAYRLVRLGLYLHLESPPPSEAGGKTQIPPLVAAKRQQLETLTANGKWEALIDESESSLGMSRFCLDLHRFTHTALGRLGDAYAPAAQVVLGELRALLTRMPSLVDLVARDGTPLVDGDTKSWISQTVLAGGGGPAISTKSGSGGSDEDAKIFAEVRGLLTTGKAPDAMRMGQARIDAATTERQRFVRRLALATTLLEAGQALLARGLYAALERELREHELFAWEPELAARCLEGFVRAIRLAAKAGARYEQADIVYERLCLLDPSAAARLAT